MRISDWSSDVCSSDLWESKTAAEWLARYGIMLDDVRSALDWAMGEGDDAGLALELAALCSPLWYQLSLQDEFRIRAEQVLERIAGRSDMSPERQIPHIGSASCRERVLQYV